jgi:trehalose 6-phosphate synthase
MERLPTFMPRPVVLAANRAPFDVDEQGRVSPAPGGLAAALAGLEQRSGQHWVACARTVAERALAEGAPATWRGEGRSLGISYAPVDPAAYALHYATVANPALWLLHHGLAAALPEDALGPRLERAWRHGYQPVNRTMASQIAAVCSQLTTPAVLVQDYHLHLTPALLRDRAPHAAVHHFLHVPWPEPATWDVLPPALVGQLLAGLLGSDALAVQTQQDAARFLATCEERMGARVHWARGTIAHMGRQVSVRAHPMPLDLERLRREAAAPEVAAEATRLAARRPELLLLRVDRVDPTKNVVAGFRAYARLLAEHPELHERVEFWALVQPSRQDIAMYRDHLLAVQAAAAAVNREFERPGWQPVWLSLDHPRPTVLAALRQFDCLLVNAARDGMNLVAKEGALLNERDGTVVLSTAAGAYDELHGAVLGVDPVDEAATARAIHRSLTLGRGERRWRARMAADRAGARTIDDWLGEMLDDLPD